MRFRDFLPIGKKSAVLHIKKQNKKIKNNKKIIKSKK
jgi:hypothetical protein